MAETTFWILDIQPNEFCALPAVWALYRTQAAALAAEVAYCRENWDEDKPLPDTDGQIVEQFFGADDGSIEVHSLGPIELVG